MKLSDIAKRIISESTLGASKKWAIQIDDANSSMTAEEYEKLFPSIGITVLKQKGQPDTLSAERGISSYYTFIVSASDEAIDNFSNKYPNGVDVTSADDITEDTWGNTPSAAAGMSPGKTPNAVSPATQPVGGTKFYDVGKEFQNFEKTVEREEDAASKTLEGTLKQNVGGKKVVAKASKGSVGQTEQDYTIDVESVDVTYMSDKHYIILKGTDGKDYYIDTAFKIKVLGAAEKEKTSQPSSAILVLYISSIIASSSTSKTLIFLSDIDLTVTNNYSHNNKVDG
jgi:hypothetical protein